MPEHVQAPVPLQPQLVIPQAYKDAFIQKVIHPYPRLTPLHREDIVNRKKVVKPKNHLSGRRHLRNRQRDVFWDRVHVLGSGL